ncbi:MAG: carboxypeptidase regulatory-like domain-containing protein [Verrucomicrobia bacterium]|nr:carboxypeptidase regulatory-like domain-containing protein [Verrucomicrobiota bacterium]
MKTAILPLTRNSEHQPQVMPPQPSAAPSGHRWLRSLTVSPGAVLAMFLLAAPAAPAQTRYEAENATLANAGKNYHANASPTGSTANNCVSQGNDVSGVNNGTVTFSNVTVPTSGLYTMTVGYYEAWGTRNTYISVNDKQLATPVACPNGAGADLLGAVTASVPLKAGINNTIAIYNYTGWGPHWDYIEIPAAPASLLAFVTASAVADGTISPSGLVAVTPGGSQNFTVTPNNAYMIDTVMDGTTQLTEMGGVYAIGPVNDDSHIVVATFKLAPTHTLSGSVTDAQGGGATVSVKGAATSLPLYTATTDAAGNYSLPVPEGTWYVCASQTGYMISADTNVTISSDQTVNFTLVAGRSIPQMENLLFAADSSNLGEVGTSGNWPLLYSTYPGITQLTAVNTPMVAKVRGIKYDNNLRAEGDGYRLNTVADTNPIPTNGATIVTVVKPVRNGTHDSFNPIVSIYYGNLNLSLWNDTGIIRVRRTNSDYNSTTAIPNGQLTLLSLVVQPDGQFKVWASAWNESSKQFDTATVILSSTATSTFTAFIPNTGGTNGYRQNIMVGRNDNSTNYTFNGFIGDVFVYKTALSDADRATLGADINTKLTSIPTYDITATAGPGGSISPDGVTAVGESDNLTYTITPQWDYDVAQVMIDGTTPAGPVTTYTFENVTAAHMIDVTFAAKPTVSVSGTVTVGGVATDGATVNAYTDAACANLVTTTTISGSTYTMPLPQNTTFYLKTSKSGFAPSATLTVVVATADLPDQDLNLTSRRYEAENAALVNCNFPGDFNELASGGKRASGAADVAVLTFSVDAQTAGDYSIVMGYFQPWDGNRDTRVTVNGTALPNIPALNVPSPNYGKSTATLPLVAGVNSVVLSNIGTGWGPHWDYIDISAPVYYVSASAGTHGSISPNGAVGVAPGADQSYTITPDSGYAVDVLTVDGTAQPAHPTSYTFSDVRTDHTIAVTFVENSTDPYTDWLTNPPHWTLTGGDAEKTADPDGDDMTNLQEFAFGLDPTKGSSVNPITIALDQATGKFSYTRLAASGLAYHVFTSTDLQAWAEEAYPVNETVTDPDPSGVVTVEVTVAALPASGKLFVRVAAQ